MESKGSMHICSSSLSFQYGKEQTVVQTNIEYLFAIGTKSFYTPTLTRVEYEQKCAEEILQEAYGGTLANFIAALTGKDSITEIDKDELLDYILSRK